MNTKASYKKREKLERRLISINRDLAYNSFYHYIKQAWNNIEGVEFIDSWHIGCIAEHLQAQLFGDGRLQKLIINIQPRLSKSIISSVLLPTFAWIHFPHYKILNFSHSLTLAGMFTYNSRILIESDWYGYWRESLGFDLVPGDTQKFSYSNTKLGYRKSYGVQSRVTGVGGDINIIDDPNDLADFNSIQKKKAVINTYSTAWKSRVTGKQSKWILIQQRIPGGEDLTQYLLENESKDWFRLNIPTEYKKSFTFKSPIKKNDPRKENELVCPKRFDSYLAEKSDLFRWSAIYQQEPTTQGGNIIKTAWLNKYKINPLYLDMEFISCDFALETDYDKADYTVFTRIGVKNTKFYVLDMYRANIDFPTQLKEFKLFCKKYPRAELKLIEDKMSGKAFKQMMQREMAGIVGVDIKNKTKEERLYTATPTIIAGKLYIPDITHDSQYYKHKWVDALIGEFSTFPSGVNDDILDTITQFINYYNATFGVSDIVYDTMKDKQKPIFELEETYKTEKHINDVSRIFAVPGSSGDYFS